MSDNIDESHMMVRWSRGMVAALLLFFLAAGCAFAQAADSKTSAANAEVSTPAEATAPLESDPTRVQPFGFDFFPDAPINYTIAPDAPVPEDYRLDKGDKLRIRYWTPIIPESAHELIINDNGCVQIPDIGDIRAAGLTREEFRRKLREKLNDQLKNPSFAADLIETRKIVVFVTGMAKHPGRYMVKAESNLFNVIYSAGGPSLEGSMRRISLLRKKSSKVTTTDLYGFLVEGKSDKDVVLQDQDTIFFPIAGSRVMVKGQVNHPAIYELLEKSTLSDVLHLAGGLRPSAQARIVRLERIEDGKRIEITLDASAVLQDASHADNIVLKDGDTLGVEEVSKRVYQRVSIRGNVTYPGDYSTQRTPTAKALLEQAKLRTGTYLDRADLMRVLKDGTPVVVPIPLQKLLDGAAADIALTEHDEVVIYRSDEKARIPLVTVEGPVKNPATYRKSDGMRVSDLLFAAGGISRDAAPDIAHVYRIVGPDDSKIIRISPSKAAAGSEADDIVLEPDDKLVIYRQREVDYKRESVTILGEVQRPGEYKAHEGLSLYDLIIQAGGPTDLAAGSVEIASPVDDPRSNRRAEVKICTLSEAMSGDRRDEPITAGMLISLPKRGDKRSTPPKVELAGQFGRPGTYALLYEGETLGSLIERAGGLGENADPFGMSVTRRKDQMLSSAAGEQLKTVLDAMDQLLPSVSDDQNASLLKGNGEMLSSASAGYAMGGMSAAETVLLVSPRRLNKMATSSRITFSLEDKQSFLKRIGSMHLADGDRIEVPRKSEVVQVLGAVQAPGPVYCIAGYSAKDYIQRAGGGTPDADFKRAVVVSVSGTVQRLNDVNSVNPGDVIVVASKHQVIQPPRQRSLYETLGNLLGVALVVRSFK